VGGVVGRRCFPPEGQGRDEAYRAAPNTSPRQCKWPNPTARPDFRRVLSLVFKPKQLHFLSGKSSLRPVLRLEATRFLAVGSGTAKARGFSKRLSIRRVLRAGFPIDESAEDSKFLGLGSNTRPGKSGQALPRCRLVLTAAAHKRQVRSHA